MKNPILSHIEHTLQKATDENRFRTVRGMVPQDGARIVVDGQACIDFSSNDYLGLSRHEEVVAAAKGWTDLFGAGCRASRLVTGTLDAVLGLENRIARWKGTEAAMIFGSGYSANVGILKSFASRDTVFIGDKLNHASLHTGCQDPLSTYERYRHNDLAHLRDILAALPPSARKVIVSDTVFSMDGDIADVEGLRALAREFNALLYLDDAHAGGILGSNGKGLAGSDNPAEIAMGTFSKAFGSYGAYAACSARMRDWLINACGSFIFTTALTPAVYGAIDGALGIVASGEGERLRKQLHDNASQLRDALCSHGFNIGNSQTPIIPVIFGDNTVTKRAAVALRERGLLCMAICPPTVPQGQARLRIALSATHSRHDIEALVAALNAIQEG